MVLDWSAIRPLNGSRDEAFEELCAQLARAERPQDSRFERKGTPDAGVECYAVLPDGSEWGWQAKYFLSALGDAQWKQIDESVSRALEKHPRLVTYYVCVPRNRSDGRIDRRLRSNASAAGARPPDEESTTKRQASEKDRWDQHVPQWTAEAHAKGMSVEFVFWGASELLEFLSQARHAGRRAFWFDVAAFEPAWFQARLDEAVKAAGPRYTPEVHVDLPIARDFGSFGRTASFCDALGHHAHQIRQELYSVDRKAQATGLSLDDSPAAELLAQVHELEGDLSNLAAQANDCMAATPLLQKLGQAWVLVDRYSRWQDEREQQEQRTSEGDGGRVEADPLDQYYQAVWQLGSAIRHAAADLRRPISLAGGKLVLLVGAAGNGKTHLLCDLAKRRLADNRPTVLLMGQRFLTTDDPWTQALQQLDLAGYSAEEFVGALEAAAESAGCRALVMIDALNEGAGRLVWPEHLTAFLARLEQSPWIGVVLSVRSSFENVVVPEAVRSAATTITHDGFASRQYEATRAFFTHYGLELPSTPTLTPEFANPLFLKILCRGLQASGQQRVPRGFHGISKVFDLYLDGVEGELAKRYDYDARDRLLRRAIEELVGALVGADREWVPRQEAKQVVDALLPGRDYGRSLFHAMVSEGLLLEYMDAADSTAQDGVAIGYERLGHRLMARRIVERALGGADGRRGHEGSDVAARSDAARQMRQPAVAFVANADRYVSPGMLEALCTAVAELTGFELAELVPEVLDQWGHASAFRQSLIWRVPTAVVAPEVVCDLLNKVTERDQDGGATWDTVLTVACLPEHPLNADFLDRRLRRDAMPDRDAWWSTMLHHFWQDEEGRAVRRLVHWAAGLPPNAPLDDDVIDLSATALAWMFTTSNRPLRDQSTIALANLLMGRLDAVGRLVDRFAEVDDPYVTERVYAVAYGAVMGSQDPAAVKALAETVYRHVFAQGQPPAHLLLRDYARGVVERAAYLGVWGEPDLAVVRPPYGSSLPAFPSESDVADCMPDESRGSSDSGDLEWARSRIEWSVMSDDFAHYVIGDNYESTSSDFTSLRLSEPLWQTPAEQLEALVGQFGPHEQQAWDAYQAANAEYRSAMEQHVDRWLAERAAASGQSVADLVQNAGLEKEFAATLPADLHALGDAVTEAGELLDAVLTDEHQQALGGIKDREGTEAPDRPPRLELKPIQRYILQRVFDLGWTTERFGHFDQFDIGYHGREAAKPERIGKKYQWQAYHEVMAFIADNYQYRKPYEDDDRLYEGPWQIGVRDIDPSCVPPDKPGGTSFMGTGTSWWCPDGYTRWDTPSDGYQWALSADGLPCLPELLGAVRPDDGTRWISAQTYLHWAQPRAAGTDGLHGEQRELWFICNGYLTHASEAEAFLAWAEENSFRGRWMPEPLEVHGVFLGEFGWAPAWQHFVRNCDRSPAWVRPDLGCPVDVLPVALRYPGGISEFDCSAEDGCSYLLPCAEVVAGIGLTWTGRAAAFVDHNGQPAALDPTAELPGPDALLIREDALRAYLDREQLTLCWTLLGEKQSYDHSEHRLVGRMVMSGALRLDSGSLRGFLNRTVESDDGPEISELERMVTWP